MTTTDIDPAAIATLHDVRDADKLEALAKSMQANGWIGRPLLVLDVGGDTIQAITGSHRIPAARQAGLTSVPCVVLDLRGHVCGEDGWCVVCGEGRCVTELLLEGRDDDDRLAACEEIGGDVAELMQAEVEANY